MRRTVAICLLVLVPACSERLTAPEAEAVLSAVEQPQGDRELHERLGNRMGWADELGRLSTVSRVRVRRDGRERSYSAIVFERVMVPPTGSGRSSCLGPRWSLFLWREDERPEGLVLTGGRFDRPLSPGGLCADITFSDPAPVVVWYPPEAPDEQPAWVSGSGRGEIGPGMDSGPCEFLAPAEAQALYRSRGVTCRLTLHRVRLQSTLHPIAPEASAVALVRGRGAMRVEVPQVDVVGVRYTIECGLPQAAEMCRQGRP
jgi:hypothetical protein